MTTPSPTPAEITDAIRRLAALKLLDDRRTRLDLELKAARKNWADELGEKSKELHGAIEAPNPGKLKECKIQLNTIRDLYLERKDMEAAKKTELDAVTSKVNKVGAAIVELIRADPEDLQQELELDEMVGPSLNMTGDTAKMVGEAIQDLTREGAEITPDVKDLHDQIAEMGLHTGPRLVDEGQAPGPGG